MITAKDKILFFVLMAAGFIGTLSQNLLTSALPSIIGSFGITPAVGQWLTTSYILLMGVMTALSAYMYNRFSTRRLILISIGVFIFGCMISLTAADFRMLLVGRFIQAFGAGPTIPLLQIAAVYIYQPEHQGEALGLTGIIVGFAPAIGPTLSGILTDLFGWRSIFAFLIAVAAICLLIGWIFLRDIGERKRIHLDWLSVFLYSSGFCAIMLAVTAMENGTVFSVNTIGMLVAGIICLAAFVSRQNALKEPLLLISLLRNRSLVYGTVLLGTAYFMNMAGTILVPLFNQSICNYSATTSGLMMLPGSLLIAILSPCAGRLMDRYGAMKTCLAGMLFMLTGNAIFALLSQQASIIVIVCVYALRCLGMTFLMTPSTALGVQKLTVEEKPYGMAIMNSARQMSGALFSTILVVAATISSVSESADIDITGMHTAFIIMTLCSLIGVFLIWRLKE